MGASRKRERAYHARSTTPGLSFEPRIGQTAGYLLGIEMGQSATTAVVVRECLEAYDKLLIASCTATTPGLDAQAIEFHAGSSPPAFTWLECCKVTDSCYRAFP